MPVDDAIQLHVLDVHDPTLSTFSMQVWFAVIGIFCLLLVFNSPARYLMLDHSMGRSAQVVGL